MTAAVERLLVKIEELAERSPTLVNPTVIAATISFVAAVIVAIAVTAL